MKILADDSSFGLQITPAGDQFSRIRILLGPETIGDYEPAIIWSDIQALTRLSEISDPRLDPVRSAAEIRDVLLLDEELHDLCLPGLGESFDRWLVLAYCTEGSAVFLVAEHDTMVEDDLKLVVVPITEYRSIVGTALDFYERLMRTRRIRAGSADAQPDREREA